MVFFVNASLSPMARAASSASSAGKPGAGYATSRLFAFCLVFRVANAFAVRTYFNADEFWQGPEVAHRVVFGYGHLTWEWQRGLRGYAHVAIFAGVYKLAALLGADTTFVIAWGPRVAQAAIAAVGDVYTHELARRWFRSASAARYATFCSLACWFNFFCGVRTFSNCLEAVLTAAALAHWPWGRPGTPRDARASDRKRDEALFPSFAANRKRAIAFAGAACLIRPTAATYFLPLFVTELARTTTKATFLCRECLPVAVATIALGVGVDRAFSGETYVAAWNFFKFNVNEGGSAAYGTHPWHWYLTQGFPAVATVFAPLAALGCVSGTLKGARAWEPFAVAGYCVLGHSLAAHKEFRFLMPALPPTLAAAGGALAAWQTEPKTAWRTRRAVALVLLTQIPAAAYLSWWHQSGTVAAVRHVAALAAAGETRAGGVFFATPCHQHPFHTHAHLPSRVPVPMSFLECPPASAEGRGEHEPDEADRFFADPETFLDHRFGSVGDDGAPSHVVVFDGTSRDAGMRRWLEKWDFEVQKRLFHAHFAVDRELQAEVLVFARPEAARRAEAPPRGSPETTETRREGNEDEL